MTPSGTAVRPAGFLVALSVGFAVLVGLFGWSLTAAGHDPALHQVKIAVVGPAPAVSTLRSSLKRNRPGAIQVVSYRAPGAAMAAIQDRSVYAAVTLAPPHLYVASAAGPAVSAALEATIQGAFRARGLNVAVSDVRPLDPGDPRGLAVLYIVISTVIGSVAFGVVRFILFPDSSLPLTAAPVVGFALLAGLAEAISVVLVVGALGGAFGSVLLGAGMLALAVTTITTGLTAVLKLPGAGVVALVVVIAGNASSGGASAPELVDGFWRHVGPYLPPGAGASLLRNLVYFDGNSIAGPLVVLLVYLLIGTGMAASSRFGLARSPSPGGSPPPRLVQ